MKDIVTYCGSVPELVKELKALSAAKIPFVNRDENGKLSFSGGQGHSVYKDGRSLYIARVNNQQLSFIESLKSIDIVAYDRGGDTFDFLPDGEAKYNSVYSTEPYEITDEDGGSITITPPKKFATFL